MSAILTIGAVVAASPLSPAQLLNDWNVVTWFVPHQQKRVMAELMRRPDYQSEPVFDEPIQRLRRTIDAMPRTGQTDGQGDEAVAHLHYFGPDCDWWITELDVGSPDDGPGFHQHQAFGLARIWEVELGYISLNELTTVVTGDPFKTVELDLYWQPKTLAQIKAGLRDRGQ